MAAPRVDRERREAEAEAERLRGILHDVARSKAWRFGHSLIRLARRLTFRPGPRGPDLEALAGLNRPASAPSGSDSGSAPVYDPALGAKAVGIETAERRELLARYADVAARAELGTRASSEADDVRSGIEALVGGDRPLTVVFVLAGLDPRGGGGTHSIHQEARGMRALGIDAVIAVPEHGLTHARRLYPEGLDVFQGYADAAGLDRLTREADVLVATHWRSVQLVRSLVERRDSVLPAYYVQDYEPFFAAKGSVDARSARGSYHAIAGQLLFAKTHWLCEVVAAAEGLPVAKVAPSLDASVFHARARPPADGRVRVTAMIRPATPRRQPASTLRVLAAVQRALGAAVEIRTFGCDGPALGRVGGQVGEHLGALVRGDVADVLRRSDVFLDMSVYQAFGRTGLEAMACGATALLPRLGAAREYATDGHDALLVDTADEDAVISVLRDLASDQPRLRRLQQAASETAAQYSIARAALTEYGVLRAMYDDRFRGS